MPGAAATGATPEPNRQPSDSLAEDTSPAGAGLGPSSAPTGPSCAPHDPLDPSDRSALPTTAGVPPATSAGASSPSYRATGSGFVPTGSAPVAVDSGLVVRQSSAPEFMVGDTASAPVGSIDLGTGAAMPSATGRAGAWWVAFSMTTAAVVALGIGAAVMLREPVAAPQLAITSVPVAPPVAEPSDSLPDSLWQLARLNEPDDERASNYTERHRLLAMLSATADANRIDIRRNLALDLVQSHETDDPCVVIGSVVTRIELAPDLYFLDALRRVEIPIAGAGCQGLDARRLALLGEISDEPTPSPVAEPAPEPSRKKRRPKKAVRRKKEVGPTADHKPKDRSSSGLRPFGG